MGRAWLAGCVAGLLVGGLGGFFAGRRGAVSGSSELEHLEIAVMGFERYAADARANARSWHCSYREVLLERHREQESNFNFVAIVFRVYETPLRSRYDAAAGLLDQAKRDLQAMPKCD